MRLRRRARGRQNEGGGRRRRQTREAGRRLLQAAEIVEAARRQPQIARHQIGRDALALLPRISLGIGGGISLRCRQPGCPAAVYRADYADSGEKQAGEGAAAPD